MKKLKESVSKIMTEELERANNKFPMFHSAHEGYAIMKEEKEETEEELQMLNIFIEEMWEDVKGNANISTLSMVAEAIKDRAINSASEAIQVAAMAQKFIDSFKVE